MKKKILFVINPIAGGKSKGNIPSLISENLDQNKFEYEIVLSKFQGHAFDISKKAVIENFDAVIAVGGDGTVNEVAKALVNTRVVLGLLPFGSGNGLARTLKIPRNSLKAIQLINEFTFDKIDSARLNEYFFFNMAGTGFDAHISAIFANDKKRGFFGYLKAVIKEMTSYKEDNYAITVDEHQVTTKAIIVSIANSSQYGNEAHIAPRADVKDGKLDIVIVKPFPWYFIPVFGIRMFAKSLDKFSYVIYMQGKNISINRTKSGPIHIDGEPKMEQANLTISIDPLSLKIIVPENE